MPIFQVKDNHWYVMLGHPNYMAQPLQPYFIDNIPAVSWFPRIYLFIGNEMHYLHCSSWFMPKPP